MPKFNVGDRVRVTGDSADAGHGFDDGVVGVITVDYEGSWLVDDDLYHVIAPDEEAWWVNEVDLEPVESSSAPSSHALVLGAIPRVIDMDLPDHIKTSVIKTLVDAL